MPVAIRDDILLSVEKPARYTGGEWNSIVKPPSSVDIRFAFCFPDTYEVGMSHLGMRILYHLLNERSDTCCERVFAPWTDMEEKMRENGIPLFSLENREPVKDFDFIGFTLQYEMSYTNVLNMLDLAGIPLLSADRKDGQPFVCAGGPCAYNPEPLADFIDFFVLGEGEEVINELMDAYKEWKKEGVSREAFLNKIVGIEGIYVPAFYDVLYNDDGTVRQIEPRKTAYPAKIRKRIVRDIDKAYFPEKIIVPHTSIVHDRIMLEIFRGCTRGCRFCQAGFIYRPVREKTPGRLLDLAKKLESRTGYEEISLTSLSTSDYSGLPELTSDLISEMEPKRVNLSLPSLRVDSFSLELMEKARKVRKSGLTFAPEAGTQRLRDIINKGVTEENLLDSAGLAFRGGWSGVKLYFMIGLPNETMEDIEGIAILGKKVVDEYFKVPVKQRAKGLEVTISTSSFVPKPFTPFQWEAQDTVETLKRKQQHLKSSIRDRHLKYNWHDPELSFLEAVFARGDRRTGRVLLRAWQRGCKFDSWGEHFDFDAWMGAFEDCGVDPAFYAGRKRNYEEVFPWEHIDIGVSKGYLMKENRKAGVGEVTPGCMAVCSGCGAASFDCGICTDALKKSAAGTNDEQSAIEGKTGATGAMGALPDTLRSDGGEANYGEGKCGADSSAARVERTYSMRVRFTRGEGVKFISHLDLMKVFERAVRRSGLPVAYSQGFNPHPQMVFGLPLPVGVTSSAEYADFELIRHIEPRRFMDMLNGALPEDIRVTASAEKSAKANIMALITAADYRLELFMKETVALEWVKERLSGLMALESIKVMKEGKGNVTETDIRPLVHSVEIEPLRQMPSGYEGFASAFIIHACFSAGSTANLRPELFIKALVEKAGLPVAAFRAHREALYADNRGKMANPLDRSVLI